VTPSAAVASIEVTYNGNPLAQGDSVAMTVVLRDAQRVVLAPRAMTWESSDGSIASVSPSGHVTGVSRAGSATITATREGKTGSATVTTFWAYAFSIKPTYTVSVSSNTILDETRRRAIPIIVRVAVGAPGPLPVVFDVFPLPNGHQADGPLADVIAAAGYAVIHVGTATYSQTQLCSELKVSDCDAMILPNRLAARRDVEILMDSLASIASQVRVALDPTRVAVTGTSAGAAVTMYLAGATTNLSPSVRDVSLADNRFTAFLANSAPATITDNGSASGFTNTSWANIRKPTMQQVLVADFDAAGRRGIYDAMPPGDKYLALWNTPAVTSYNPSAEIAYRALIMSNALAFLDTHLRGRVEAKEWLITNQLARGTNGAAGMSSK
jgi:hypothetical protein